jgi:uncharacterized protein YukE
MGESRNAAVESDRLQPSLYWQKLGCRQARQINIGWWGVYMVPLTTVVVLVISLLLLPARKWDLLSATYMGPVTLGILLLCGLIAYRRASKHFIGQAEVLARLDATCHLHNRLSAAFQGVGDWPDPPSTPPAKPRWNPNRTLLPLIASLSALLCATFLPLQAAAPALPPPPMRELSAWTAVELSIERLQEQGVFEEEALEAVREQLESLRAQPQENWYRPSSMEASDHLREQVGQSARDLQQALTTAAASLATAARKKLTDSARDDILKQLGETLDALEQGMLPLDAETLETLSRLATAEGLKGIALDPEALEELLKQLKEQSESLGECASACRVERNGGSCQSSCTNGQCVATGVVGISACEGDDATGGISRDKPGDTPLTFRPPQAPLQAGNPEALSNRDLRQAAVADTVGISDDSTRSIVRPGREHLLMVARLAVKVRGEKRFGAPR